MSVVLPSIDLLPTSQFICKAARHPRGEVGLFFDLFITPGGLIARCQLCGSQYLVARGGA